MRFPKQKCLESRMDTARFSICQSPHGIFTALSSRAIVRHTAIFMAPLHPKHE
jgi:hypothetical protein